MRFTQLILSLVASGTVTAIDVFFHTGSQGYCDGASVVCRALNPGVCCTAENNKYRTVGYYGIPKEWVITAYAYKDGGCARYENGAIHRGATFLCIGHRGPFYTGSDYKFGADKMRRGLIDEREMCTADKEPCRETQKADMLVLADGVSKYDIAGLEGEALDELLDLASAGATAVEVPQQFQHLAISE